MKHFQIFSTIFLSGLLFLGCTLDLDFPILKPDIQVSSNFSRVELNPTEQRLKGQWYLRSMSTKDSVYNDSISNRQKTINLWEVADPDDINPNPILIDNMSLYARVTPDTMAYYAGRETWNAPDPSTMRIIYKGFYEPGGTASFGIAKLELYQLTLVDSSTGWTWNFER